MLDPFMGGGQSAIAAKRSGRYYIGYEINPDYVTFAHKRVNEIAESSHES